MQSASRSQKVYTHLGLIRLVLSSDRAAGSSQQKYGDFRPSANRTSKLPVFGTASCLMIRMSSIIGALYRVTLRPPRNTLTPVERYGESARPSLAATLAHLSSTLASQCWWLAAGAQRHDGMALTTSRGTSMARRLNGWRRLWLAASAGLALWFVVVWPLQYVKDIAPNRHEYDSGIGGDFESGRCLTYQTAPLKCFRSPPTAQTVYTSI